MYNILKRSLATFSFVLIASVSLFFISQYKSEMLGVGIGNVSPKLSKSDYKFCKKCDRIDDG